MKLLPARIPGVHVVVPKTHHDERGSFVKVFHRDVFREHGLRDDFAEEFYTQSRHGVLRGIHLQTPPHEQAKLVYCVHGAVFDVALDLRAGSPTFGEHLTLELSAANGHALYLPPGVAHGFYTLTEPALMVYKVSQVHAPEHDTGVLWDSAGIAWPCTQPILSARDRELAPLAQFASPFTFGGGA